MSRLLSLVYLVSLIAVSVGCEAKTWEDKFWEKVERCNPAKATPGLPISYRIETDARGPSALLLDTPGGEIPMVFTPWGSHGEPHTGHPGGDFKANWIAYLGKDRSELVELVGDGNGVCDPSEYCGLAEELVQARIPRYISPDDGLVVRSVVLNTVHEPGFYYGTLNHWLIEASTCIYNYAFGHVGRVGEELRAAMIEMGAPDPETYNGPVGVNLLNGPIVLAKGERIAIPQIVGLVDERYPGLVAGDVWAQMEVPTRNFRTDRGEAIYSWQPEELQEDLQKILWREMQKPDSRFYTYWHQQEFRSWIWKAESALYATPPYISANDYNGMLSNQGSWFENRVDGAKCTDGDPLCDQAISIWRIFKAGPIYKPSTYDSADVSFLILKSQRGGVYYRGEVLRPSELGLEGTLEIKWRIEDYTTPMESYQKVSYSLTPKKRWLKLHWGEEREDRAAVMALEDPAIPTDLPCDGGKVTCMNHEWHYGISVLPGY